MCTFATMALFGLCLLTLFVVGGICDPIKKGGSQQVVTLDFLNKQADTMLLFFHAREPNHIEKCKSIIADWHLEDNVDFFNNRTAVKTYVSMIKHNWLLPRFVPFSFIDETHQYEASTLFNVLYSATDYQTFYKAAVYLRDRVNENLFVYVLSAVVIHRKDMKGFVIPPIYEVFPEYFNNGEILTTAQRINVHGEHMVKHFPSTFKLNESVVIRWNTTEWPYNSKSSPITYFTQDYALNSFYFYIKQVYPQWLGTDVIPLVNDNRGEWFWFLTKQLVARYYMERLSNGLGEIEDLASYVVKEGFYPGLLFHNGIQYPVRPNNFHINHDEFADKLSEINDYEQRIRDAIGKGYIINSAGENVDIRNPEAIDILGRAVETGVDSPNPDYYKDFISIWKFVLGNTYTHNQYYNDYVPLVVPSALEQDWTALRDPAIFMIWKRVLNLFTQWQETLPHYKTEELALPSVAIEKVDIDKLVTYFEYTYMNVSAFLHMDDLERKYVFDNTSVLVQYPRLNHKQFDVRIHVKSAEAKTVVVRFFLAPKYDSQGNKIPLHLNTQNFFMLDYFLYDLPEGDSVITRESTRNQFTTPDWNTAYSVYHSAKMNDTDFDTKQSQWLYKFPHRLEIPKGRVGGMPFIFMVYISEYRPPRVPTSNENHTILSYGFSPVAKRLSDEPHGFPLNRPLYPWQVKDLRNMMFEEVLIHHKVAPEIVVSHN